MQMPTKYERGTSCSHLESFPKVPMPSESIITLFGSSSASELECCKSSGPGTLNNAGLGVWRLLGFAREFIRAIGLGFPFVSPVIWLGVAGNILCQHEWRISSVILHSWLGRFEEKIYTLAMMNQTSGFQLDLPKLCFSPTVAFSQLQEHLISWKSGSWCDAC